MEDDNEKKKQHHISRSILFGTITMCQFSLHKNYIKTKHINKSLFHIHSFIN